MSRNKALSFLGLAQKAGKIISGYNLVKSNLSMKKKPFLLIISEDISRNTAKLFLNKCNNLSIPVIQAFTRQELGRAIGKGERAVIAVMDPEFAKELNKILAEEES